MHCLLLVDYAVSEERCTVSHYGEYEHERRVIEITRHLYTGHQAAESHHGDGKNTQLRFIVTVQSCLTTLTLQPPHK